MLANTLPRRPYFRTATLLYTLVAKAHASGVTVPLWGTCMGIQTIMCIAASGADILGRFPLYDYAYPLDFTAAASGSRLFGGMNTEVHHPYLGLPIARVMFSLVLCFRSLQGDPQSVKELSFITRVLSFLQKL